MRLTDSRSMVIITAVIGWFLPTNATAAGMTEVFSIYEAILPPAIGWILFTVIWYLTIAAAATRHGDTIGGVPPLPKALMTLLVTALLGLLMVGPLAILYLLLFFPMVTVRAFSSAKRSRINGPAAVMLRRVSIVSLLLLTGLIGTSIYIHSQRSKAEFYQLLSNPRASSQLKVGSDPSIHVRSK